MNDRKLIVKNCTGRPAHLIFTCFEGKKTSVFSLLINFLYQPFPNQLSYFLSNSLLKYNRILELKMYAEQKNGFLKSYILLSINVSTFV